MRTWMWIVVVAVGTILLTVVGIRMVLRGRRVPTRAKLALVGAVVWLLSPVDLIPDFAAGLGWLDDLTVLIAAVRYAIEHLERPDTPPAPDIERRLRRRATIDSADWRLSDDPTRADPTDPRRGDGRR